MSHVIKLMRPAHRFPNAPLLALAVALSLLSCSRTPEEELAIDDGFTPLRLRLRDRETDDTFPSAAPAGFPSSPAGYPVANPGPPAEPPRTIAVSVSAYGMAVAGADVTLDFRDRQPLSLAMQTESNGVAVFTVATGRRFFTAYASYGHYAIVICATSMPRKAAGTFHLPLVLSEQGVVVTAEIRSESPFVQSNLRARIAASRKEDERWVRATAVTSCENNRIVFPAIRTGLTGLRAVLENEGSLTCYSDAFDTRSPGDKTVVIEVPETLSLSGRALLEDGSAAEEFTLRASPLGKFAGAFQPGHFSGRLTTDDAGNYTCSPLAPAFYDIRAFREGCYGIATNICVMDSAMLDLRFQGVKYTTVKGIVVREDSERPAADAMVTMSASGGGPQRRKTGADGRFQFEVPVYPGAAIGSVRAEKEGYVSATASISSGYAGEDVLLRLQEAGAVMGTVTTEENVPVPGVRVTARADMNAAKAKTDAPSSEQSFIPPEPPAVSYQAAYSSPPTGADGVYCISNMPAPQTYTMDVASGNYFIPLGPGKRQPTAAVEPFDTVYCDLVVRPMSVILVRAVDGNEQPVLEYQLLMDITSKQSRERMDLRVKLGGDTWYRLPIRTRELYPDTLVTLKAVIEGAASEKVSNIPVCGTLPTNYVTLILRPEEPQVTGYVFLPDDAPAQGAYIDATSSKTFSNTRATADELGFFSVYGLETEENDRIVLRVRARSGAYAELVTNVPVNAENIEIHLVEQRAIVGTVYYKNVRSPASNFTIRVNSLGGGMKFTTTDGRFRYPLPFNWRMEKGTLYTTAVGYAPVQTPFAFTSSNVCDVGDIVLGGEGAVVKGRVVSQDYRPLAADVQLQHYAPDGGTWRLYTRADADSGEYQFKDLPEGDVTVSARASAGSAESERMAIKAEETKVVPDLVITTTNDVRVRFIFTLEDNRPAAFMFVQEFRAFTDGRGETTAYVKPRRYTTIKVFASWSKRPDGSLNLSQQANVVYYADPFEVTRDTSTLEVRIRSGEGISGLATINGRPISDSLVFENFTMNSRFTVVVSDGLFELTGPPGSYAVSYPRRHAALLVTLRSGDDNTVDLRSGNATLNVIYPWRGEWNLAAYLQLRGRFVMIANQRSPGRAESTTLDEMPGGTIRLTARGRSATSTTNVATTLQLANGEQRNVYFR